MSKRFVCSVLFVLVLGLVLSPVAEAADPSLVGWWKFEEASGTLYDSSNNQNNGTYNGTLYRQPGVEGYALGFDGTDDTVSIGSANRPTDTFSFGGWLKTPVTHEVDAESNAGTGGVNGQRYAFDPRHGGQTNAGAGLSVGTNGISVYEHGGGYMPVIAGYVAEIGDDWNHIMIVYDNKQSTIYLNGRAVHTGLTSPRGIVNAPIQFGGMNYGFFEGLMDEVQIYSRALTQSEIQSMVGGFEAASEPSPANEATDVPRVVVLNWTPGKFAGQHDVYFGTVFDDLDSATATVDPAGVYKGRQGDATYSIGERLDFEQTYYWRIDEVNAAPDNTIFRGDVWQFTAEPIAYPIGSITVTASSANRDDEGPDNTINGSGLDADDLHSSENTAMWLSNITDPDKARIQFEFDRVHKLYQMLVWNYNSSVEPVVGFGIKEATIEYSVDGADWAVLGDTHEFARGIGMGGYAANSTVDLGGVAARHIRITANSNWGGIVNQFGLSEVRVLSIPVLATEPSPDSGATDVDVDATLTWRAGREAAMHDVYLSADEQAVIDGTAPVATVTEHSYVPSLDLASTYYWRIDEVNDAESPATWQGDVLNFTTQEFIVVDDFESYNDIAAGEEGSNLIYLTWVDGFDNPAANGSTIGYTVPFEPTMETLIVYDGKQSVPLSYDNTVAPYSEITVNVVNLQAGHDWTKYGIRSLSLSVFGAVGNSGQLYLKINNARVDGGPDISQPGWQSWNIDLSTVGGDLTNVTSLTIGIDGANAAGKLYIDSIHLYPQVRETTGPVFSYVKITGDEDCGISTDNIYTHKLDFGQGTPGALINGVQFDAYNSAANGTLDFNRESSSGTANDHAGNGNHNVSGSLVDLLTDMYYNGGNAPGGTTTWTLSGLTAGQTYHTRIYTRQWGTSDSRNVTFVFDPDGPDPRSDSAGKVSQDNATSVGLANDNDAYYINYQYTAVEGQDLVITLTQDNNNNSWHLYGLTNQ